MSVKDEIAHIRLHVEAEAASVDESQIPGVSGRAQKVRAMLDNMTGLGRTISRSQFITELEDKSGDPSSGVELAAIDKGDDGESIRSVLQEWVGKGLRTARP